MWTRDEVEAIVASGVVNLDRVELIEGDLVEKVSKNQPHVLYAAFLVEWLMGIFGLRVVLQDAPINVAPEDDPTSLPEPDVILLNQPRTNFGQVRPRPDDIRLLIEVSESTRDFDLGTKAQLYARAGIQDYWVLDITGRRMIVHRKPREGRYISVIVYAADERVASLAAPQTELLVSDIFAG